MAVSDPTSEEDLASLLPGDPDLFIRILFEDYRKKMAACIGKHGLGLLNAHDMRDVLQDTLLAVWDKVQDPHFDTSQPVLPMVFTIVRNKAIDLRRKKQRLKRIGTNETDVTDLIISDMEGSDLAFDYRYANEEEKHKLDQMIADIIAALPEQQKLALNAFIECYEEIRKKNKHRLVAETMSRMCGRIVDAVAAKSALRAGIEKVKSELLRRGVKFVERRNA